MGIEFTYWYPIFGAQYSFIYLLTIILLLMTIISFVKSRFDLLNPSFIYCVCLTGCCTLCAIYTQKWDLPMHFNSALLIIIVSFLFLLGGNLAEFIVSDNKTIFEDQDIHHGFIIDWRIWIFFLIIMVYAAYLNYLDFLDVASQVTTEKEFTKMLFPVIDGLTHQKIEVSRWSNYRLRFATMMGYISVLAVWINLMARNYKELFKWSCYIILYFPFLLLTGGRQSFMYLIIFAMITFLFIYRKQRKKKIPLKKEISIVGVAILIFLVCFLGVGILNGKIGTDTGFLAVVVHYAGTNISAFDVYLNEILIPDNPYIGSTTLTQIYGFLYAHGVNVPPFTQNNPLFIVFGPVTTNVYTAFYRYINDYGYLGCMLIIFLIGFFYTFLYKQVYHYGLKNWMILIYASIAYPVFLMGREERFFNEILSTSKISFIIGLLILYSFFYYFSRQGSKER